MSEQQSQATPSAGPHPEAVNTPWGDPISEERQAELQGYLDRWVPPTDPGKRADGPFSIAGRSDEEQARLRLTGADVYWLSQEKGLGYSLHEEGAVSLGLADLAGANLSLAYLVGANLHGANLAGADLTRAFLEQANLTGANLVGARLDFADLTKTRLQVARLNRASLRRANLSGANLIAAHFTRADLTSANLTDSDLSGAYLTKTRVNGVDFSNVKVEGVSGIRLLSALSILQLAAVTAVAALAVGLWVYADDVTLWTRVFPWLSASVGVLLTVGAITVLQIAGGNSKLARQNFRFIARFLQASILALFLFLVGVSHVYQALFLSFGGFTSATPDYLAWLAYQAGWYVDILLFNIFDIYQIPVSPIRPDAVWSQTVVFVLNLVLVTVILQAALRSYRDIQAWRARIRGSV